ncbi:hypothetical protein P152DRAFT_261123 [Eremomyces bilateralis CBS 781.70]|uniref:Uncharacterized protein n=1 Tax=Eremomyces bilateralis CBS 781.70 TaxID=1392243 RepID=A0A6G1FQG9_9PEZI|nr:uncharacterized protein P152DRAFT_261123 [Eremomyces bilateralis CBS 781.70]KAF1807941.1 hypothetical protein P152DRAFT_261123 [Eremomyces bilateralis CBS 781.70]
MSHSTSQVDDHSQTSGMSQTTYPRLDSNRRYSLRKVDLGGGNVGVGIAEQTVPGSYESDGDGSHENDDENEGQPDRRRSSIRRPIALPPAEALHTCQTVENFAAQVKHEPKAWFNGMIALTEEAEGMEKEHKKMMIRIAALNHEAANLESKLIETEDELKTTRTMLKERTFLPNRIEALEKDIQRVRTRRDHWRLVSETS